MKRIVLLGSLSIISLCGASRCFGDAPSTSPTTRPATREAIVDLGFGYVRSDEFVWFRGRRLDGTGKHDVDRFAQAVGHPLKLAEAIDAASFVALTEQYTKDKNKVYYKWISPGRFWVVELVGADPATFEVLDHQLARDRNTVWRSDRPFAGADPATAEVVTPNFVWKDKDSVFYQAKKIEGADPKTFRNLDQGFYRDAGNVYWCNDRLAEADPNTFETFGEQSPYARDARHVWFGKTILAGVDAPTFRLVHEQVYLDKTAVYAAGREVVGADPATFAFIHRFAHENEPPQVMRPALLRDAKRHYMYEPNFSEVYALERAGDEWIVTKQVRAMDPASRAMINGGTVVVRVKDGAIVGEPVVQVDKPTPHYDAAAAEVGRVRLYLPYLARAIDAINAN